MQPAIHSVPAPLLAPRESRPPASGSMAELAKWNSVALSVDRNDGRECRMACRPPRSAACASKALAALPKADMVCIPEKLHAGGKAATVSAVLKEQITEATQERRTA
jgi:hypothetical protein